MQQGLRVPVLLGARLVLLPRLSRLRVQHPTAVIKLRALKLPMVQAEVTLFVVPDSLSSRPK